MPNRIIKESIKRSPEIDSLSWFEEVVFYRMIVTADDFGCLDGRSVVLKNDLFPTKDTITRKAIEDAISKLTSVGLLIPYVDAESGMPYIMIKKWEKHQTVRNKYRKHPAPPDDLLADRKQLNANCKQTLADRKQTSANRPYESVSESVSVSEYFEDDDEPASRAREELTDAWTENYGDEPAPGIAKRICSVAESRGFEPGLITAAVSQACLRNAASPVDYILTLFADWAQHGIRGPDQLDRYAYLRDVAAGKLPGDSVEASAEILTLSG